MPKFLVTSGSYFEPFTYDELAKPIMQTVEAHNAAQDAYDSLAMDTEALRQYLATEPENSQARAMYNAYTEKLANLQNNLWERGYNAGTRRDLASARAGYASDITRLATVISERKEKSKLHQKMKLEHPDLVASEDPIHESLDRYLDNTAGKGYFAYDGKEFEAGVATEVQAKAQSLRNSNVIKDPDLINQLTRIVNYGVTEADRRAASPIVDLLLNESKEARDAYYKKNNTSIAEQLLVETLINRYDAVGARGANLSDSERGRLINYGKAGWAHASFKPEMKDFTDPVYEENAEFRKMNKQHELNKAMKQFEYNLQHPEQIVDPDAPYTFSSIMRSYSVPGKNYEEKENKVKKRIDINVPTKLISKDGHEVTDHANASSLVYSEDLRRKMYPIVGFDIGRNPTRGVLGVDSLTPSSRYLEGKITVDGKDYFTRFEPYRDVVDPETGTTYHGAVMAWANQGEQPRIDLDRTRAYHRARKVYEDTVKKYKDNDKDIYDLATIDPDKQYEYYKEDELSFENVPLSGYKDAVMSIKDNSLKPMNITYIAEGETDKAKFGKAIGAKLSHGFAITTTNGQNSKAVGEFAFNGVDYNWREHKGATSGFHYIDKHGDISVDAIKDVNDVFYFDKNDGITNILASYVDRDSIMGDYIIVETSKSKNPVTIPVSYLKDNAITSAFERARAEIENVENDPRASREAKLYATLVQQDILCRVIREALGETEVTQGITGTKKAGTE